MQKLSDFRLPKNFRESLPGLFKYGGLFRILCSGGFLSFYTGGEGFCWGFLGQKSGKVF